MKRLEALADAIASLNDYWNPDSDAYKHRNPGMLKAKTVGEDGKAQYESIRVFTCHQGGYKALIDRLRFNCQRYKQASLKDTLAHFGFKSEFEMKDALVFIQRSLHDKTVNVATQLPYFLEQENA